MQRGPNPALVIQSTLYLRLVATAAAAAGTPAATATASTLLGLIAVPAVDGTVSAGFEGDCGLLPATGTDDRCSRWLAPRVSTTTAVSSPSARLLVLLGLTARFAALGRRVAALLEERLIFASKRKFLSAVATGELQISSHGESSLPLYVIFLYPV